MKRKKSPVEIYNECVCKNIENGCDKDKYIDPDVVFLEKRRPIVFIDNGETEVEIKMSSDGLCGIEKIRELSGQQGREIVENYKMLRKDMFKVLSWPVQSLSINQKRGFKCIFDDRLDLTLIDIQKFYNCIKDKKFSVEIVENIKENCEMSDAYLNMPTLMWLCSYKDFDEFIIGRNLMVFVDENQSGKGIYEAKSWTKEQGGKLFSPSYYGELLARTKWWRENNAPFAK